MIAVRRLLFVCLIAALMGLSSRASASPLLELSGGFGGMGSLQARHVGGSAASAYFNPALLTDAPVDMTVGVLLLNTNIAVHVDARSPENAVPDGLINATHADGSQLSAYPIATHLLQNGRVADDIRSALASRPRQRAGSGSATMTYEAVGFVVKFFEERLTLGFYGLIPNRNFTSFNSFYVDEREQYFSNSLHPELYGDRMRAVSMAVAAGIRVSDKLSLGLGATIGLNAVAKAPVYVADAGHLQDVQVNTSVGAKISLVPHGGFSWRPAKAWQLTGTVHAPQKVDVIAKYQFLLATGLEQASQLRFTYDYEPWQVGAGLGYDFYSRGERTWSATSSLLYGRWSQYIDRQATRPAGAYAWQDTLSGALGVRMREGPLAFAIDGQYKPTPVPQQTGRTNYVDNNRLGLALSLEYGFSLWKTAMKVGGQLQCYRLIERHQRKFRPPTNKRGQNRTPQLVADEVPDDALILGEPVSGRDGVQTNNPGWPGFKSLGWVSGGGFYVSMAI